MESISQQPDQIGTEGLSPEALASFLPVHAFLDRFQADSFVQMALEKIRNVQKKSVQLRGLAGSLDAILAALAWRTHKGTHLLILADKEEAAYFYQDLRVLLPEKNILYFPTSYRKNYEFLEVENANIVQRAEVMSALSEKHPEGEVIVTYPEALNEKVINQRTLLENSFQCRPGQSLGVDFLTELLDTYHFERTEFVYEAGQFAVRGGIIDVYSYSNELPFRIELFGDEIESIRTFDPISQLSVESREVATLTPNVRSQFTHEVRESFLRFLPAATTVWIKDVQLTLEVVDESFKRAEADFAQILKKSGYTQVISQPDALFETRESFLQMLRGMSRVEFGQRFHFKDGEQVAFRTQSQPSFNKDFNLIAESLRKHHLKGWANYVVAEQGRQLERLKMIFGEMDQQIAFEEVNISLRGGFFDEQLMVACYTDHQIFDRYHRYHTRRKHSKNKALTLKELRSLHVGDYVVHEDYGVARFGGMEKIQVNGGAQEAIRLIFRDDDLLYISIHALHKISRYSGKEGTPPPISKLGSGDWEQKKKRVKKRVKDIAKELIALYARRKSAHGFAFTADSYLQAELESSFLYEDTPDQAKATADVKEDMEKPYPMDRLVCGDVGFGKTEVAIRAAFKAVCDGKQVALLVPTTVLALQHYRTVSERLEQFPCTVEHISRFRSAKAIKEVLKKVEKGQVDILIGTHRITSKDVKFKDLGLLIIDEEQKFGVKTKERLREMKINVDTLTLTATPIPRTLQFSLLGARDFSVIATPPPNRQPVTTEIHNYNEEIIRDAVSFELKRGGQVFFVHNRVGDIESMANRILELVPDARVAYAHGQMEGSRLEDIMMKFIDGEYDVLVSTNIIESGLDIPSANTIIINRANLFGLSDLHQMRGRVGRSNRKAYCYLLVPSVASLSSDARKRLSAMEEFSDLGDGFRVAMRDLDIRGAGDLLGGEQSGFINDLGFDMYNKVLDEAVRELKEEEFQELFAKEGHTGMLPPAPADCTIETDLEIIIPESYIANVSERLNLYIEADELKNEAELEAFRRRLADRFGPLPASVEELLKTVRLRWIAQGLGLDKLVLKSGSLKGFLPEQQAQAYYQSDIFGRILHYVNHHARQCRLKEFKNRLILSIENIRSADEALNCLASI